MSYVPLKLAKAQLLVIHDADDLLIQHQLDAAEAYCAHYMNREAISDAQMYPWSGVWNPTTKAYTELLAVPKSVVQAVLLKVTDFYENRTPTAFQEDAVYALLDQQRRCLGA